MIRAALSRIRIWADTWRRRAAVAIIVLVMLWALTSWYGMVRPLPTDLGFRGDPIAMEGTDLRFLTDLTYHDSADNAVRDQHVFDEIIDLFDGAAVVVVG